MKTTLKIPEKSIFSGIQPFTTIDDFGHLGATIFTGGCNFRCFYCHNPDFVIPSRVKYLELKEVLNFLEKRKNLIETIIVCGGEPTIHKDLIDWLKYIKSLGYRIKLDTNATNPIMFKKIIDEKLVDFFAIDFKASSKNYKKVISVDFDVNIILENLKYLVKSGIEYEIRTTIHSSVHDKKEIFDMIRELKSIGIENYYLQLFKMPKETVGKSEDSFYKIDFFDDIKEILKKNFKKTGIRNLN